MNEMKRHTRPLCGWGKQACAVIAAIMLAFLLPLNAQAAPEYDCLNGQHRYVEIDRIPATPSTDGEVNYRCELCGKRWYDILFATDHIWGDWLIDKDADCTEPGERHRTCTRGATHDQYEQIPALGHEYRESIASQPKCEADGVKTFSCFRCGNSYTEQIKAIGHEYAQEVIKKPTCSNDGEKIFVCKHNSEHKYNETIPALGHDFGEWFVETPAAEGSPGVEARVCSRNKDHQEIKEIPALPISKSEKAEEKSAFNLIDIIIGSINLALIGTFSVLLHPYIKWSGYIRRRRKEIQRINEIRKLVAKYYDFK